MKTDFKNISDLKRTVADDPNFQAELQKDPVGVIANIQDSPLTTDVWIYRIVVIALGTTILSLVLGVLILVGTGQFKDDKAVPTILTAIGSAAIGALAGLLAPSPQKTPN
ncbi:hypothetical protein HK413_04320 [Mucilaginibacter sp. S1162]|uniref:Uncharacterized protein n=1 Tax=Mucilaginibacter humi TaxID=2732510 RepID=A0ABX1W1M7_9SPHI|nr:hypothetical protein [Mucilaginibacter humi]NNU33561.1 hypothetical protein [Mucilaginibacter humi]